MKHLVEHLEPVPYDCADCIHFIESGRCKAFDPMPIDVFDIGEDHKKVIQGQNGDYVFETTKERQYDRVYVNEEFDD